jgi:hypothetical protein
VTPVPVAILLPSVPLNESTPLVVLGLIPLVRAVFIAVPSVIVLVALVVVSLVDFALPVFLVPVTLPIFLVPVVLRAGRGHRRNRRSKGSSQKKRTEIWVSTVHVGLLWREIHIRRIPLTSLSALGAPKTGQYCSDALKEESRRLAGNGLLADPFCSKHMLGIRLHRGYVGIPTCPASPPHTTFAPLLHRFCRTAFAAFAASVYTLKPTPALMRTEKPSMKSAMSGTSRRSHGARN